MFGALRNQPLPPRSVTPGSGRAQLALGKVGWLEAEFVGRFTGSEA